MGIVLLLYPYPNHSFPIFTPATHYSIGGLENQSWHSEQTTGVMIVVQQRTGDGSSQDQTPRSGLDVLGGTIGCAASAWFFRERPQRILFCPGILSYV